MKQQQNYSLSNLLDEMIKRQDRSSSRNSKASMISIAAGMSIVKVLKDSHDHALPLTTLARSAGMKIWQCQELTEQLRDEGLVNIEQDDISGNDRIILTDKGLDMS